MKNECFDNDSPLIEGCLNGDFTAWSRLIKKYSPLISGSIKNRLKKYGLTLPSDEIQDIFQNVLASIWKDRKLESVRSRDDISYWLAVVSGNFALEHARKKRSSEPVKTVSIFDKIYEKEIAELIPSNELAPADELNKNETAKRIDEAIESLPKKEKLIIKLNLLHDKKYDEIADILGLPPGTISSYIKRTKEKLRTKLKYLQ